MYLHILRICVNVCIYIRMYLHMHNVFRYNYIFTPTYPYKHIHTGCVYCIDISYIRILYVYSIQKCDKYAQYRLIIYTCHVHQIVHSLCLVQATHATHRLYIYIQMSYINILYIVNVYIYFTLYCTYFKHIFCIYIKYIHVPNNYHICMQYIHMRMHDTS